jgi:hypothetical protein
MGKAAPFNTIAEIAAPLRDDDLHLMPDNNEQNYDAKVRARAARQFGDLRQSNSVGSPGSRQCANIRLM